MPALLSGSGNADWVFNLRDHGQDSDSDEDSTRDSGRSSDSQLIKAMDLSSREDTAHYKPNPWAIAKLNAACRAVPTAAGKPLDVPLRSKKTVSQKHKQITLTQAFQKQTQARPSGNSTNSSSISEHGQHVSRAGVSSVTSPLNDGDKAKHHEALNRPKQSLFTASLSTEILSPVPMDSLLSRNKPSLSLNASNPTNHDTPPPAHLPISSHSQPTKTLSHVDVHCLNQGVHSSSMGVSHGFSDVTHNTFEPVILEHITANSPPSPCDLASALVHTNPTIDQTIAQSPRLGATSRESHYRPMRHESPCEVLPASRGASTHTFGAFSPVSGTLENSCPPPLQYHSFPSNALFTPTRSVHVQASTAERFHPPQRDNPIKSSHSHLRKLTPALLPSYTGSLTANQLEDLPSGSLHHSAYDAHDHHMIINHSRIAYTPSTPQAYETTGRLPTRLPPDQHRAPLYLPIRSSHPTDPSISGSPSPHIPQRSNSRSPLPSARRHKVAAYESLRDEEVWSTLPSRKKLKQPPAFKRTSKFKLPIAMPSNSVPTAPGRDKVKMYKPPPRITPGDALGVSKILKLRRISRGDVVNVPINKENTLREKRKHSTSTINLVNRNRDLVDSSPPTSAPSSPSPSIPFSFPKLQSTYPMMRKTISEVRQWLESSSALFMKSTGFDSVAKERL